MGFVIIRSGALGAYVASRSRPGRWFEAYWTKDDASHVVDVTGKDALDGYAVELAPFIL